ncbi:hypothetical protein PR048_013226 [Dryococelus australis]|uniref:Uncharacterized protein n=1 Tax=Dryococelus australis TaxID=614101 RepID=A0ABQ9HRI7_9NEOP|nr:hypothetical protein PR048_013226 [Dryococelus australis]
MYIPSKPRKYDIKIFSLTDKIYNGKLSVSLQNPSPDFFTQQQLACLLLNKSNIQTEMRTVPTSMYGYSGNITILSNLPPQKKGCKLDFNIAPHTRRSRCIRLKVSQLHNLEMNTTMAKGGFLCYLRYSWYECLCPFY